MGKTFLVVGGPGAPGGKILGVGPKLKTASARGHPRVQKKIVFGPMTQHTEAQWPPQEVKFLKISHERPTFGAPVAPTLGDGGERFTALPSTTDRLTNLKESPF